MIAIQQGAAAAAVLLSLLLVRQGFGHLPQNLSYTTISQVCPFIFFFFSLFALPFLFPFGYPFGYPFKGHGGDYVGFIQKLKNASCEYDRLND